MNLATKKSSLSPARQKLLRLMQSVNFGRIEQLRMSGGEPVFAPPPRVIREIKFGADNGPRPEQDLTDFTLKTQHCELFATLDRMGDRTVESLEVQHGLPFRIKFEEAIGA
ncbi:MAG: hypothetical protein GX444_09440 [Myxococcales bacterium]|nr:hypothetical protein [Myxococcales bacterium]